METFKLFFERALGLIEVVEFKELGPVDAKVDSGNGAFNVIHGTDLEEYGDSVNFKTIDGKGLTKKIHDYISINIGAGKVEKRPVVTFDIKFAGKLWKNVPFSISDRSTNEQQILIGKDFIIKNGGIIDVTKEYNLGESVIAEAKKKEKITLTDNDIQKITRLANTGVSAEDISTLTDIDLHSVLDNMPGDVKKQTSKITKSSKPVKKVIKPIPEDITSQFVDYLSTRNSPTLQSYIDHKLKSSGIIFKNAEQIINNLKYSDNSIRKFLSELKDLNIKIQNSERQWLNARGVRETISRGAKKAWKTMNTELRQFSNSKEGLQYKQKLIDSGLDERSIEIEMRKEMNRRKQEAAKKGEAFIPDEEFSDIPGKLENRKFEFKAISPYVKRMPKTIKVVSLPADYAFEKAFIQTFDKNIQSYGFRGNELHKLRTIAKKVQQESDGKITPSGLSHKNINLFLQKPDKYFFSGLSPKESSMRVQTRKPMPTDADIIDLDYLGMPGSMVGSIPMRLNSLHNPFLYPILAAKNCLKPGGLVFVTYTILGPHNMNFFKTDAYKKQNNIFNYRIPTNGSSKLGYFDKNKLPERVKKSMQTAADPQQRYNLSANVANLYLAGILDCAEANNVNIKPIYTNIYSGSPPHVMWRGVFVKQ